MALLVSARDRGQHNSIGRTLYGDIATCSPTSFSLFLSLPSLMFLPSSMILSLSLSSLGVLCWVNFPVESIVAFSLHSLGWSRTLRETGKDKD